jgi:Cytochrome C oxidase, cbb3-type, subunit III
VIRRATLIAAAPWLLCCASNQQIATIEPTPTAAPEPTSTSDAIDMPAPPRQATKRVVADATFVLSRDPPVQPAVGKPVGGPGGGEFDWIHVAEKWWKFRAEFVNLSEDEVRTRDEAITDDGAPTGFWDRQTAVETALIWTSLCNECHGGRRKIEDAIGMPVPPPSWGHGQGLFFGQRRGYKEVFAKVLNGGGLPKEDGKRPMPPWRGKLAREEIWALLYFLEYQSGGIEGRFPPSLYPRMPVDFPAGE